MNLIQSVHAVGESLVVQDEEEDYCLLFVSRLAVDESDGPVLHLRSPYRLGVDVVELFDLESRLASDAHALALAEHEDRLRLLGVELLGEFLAVLLVVADGLLDVGRHILQLLPKLLDHLQRSVVLLLCDFGCELDQVEHLMEEALCGGHADLASDFDVDGEVDLPGERRALHVDDADSVDVLHRLQLVDNPDQVLGFPRLTDHHHCLVLSDIVLVQLGRVDHVELLETF